MKPSFLSACCLLVVGESLHAGLITTYNFKDAPGDQASTTATNVAAGLVAGAITRGGGLTANLGGDSINSRAWTTSGTVDPIDFYTFTLTPQTGFELTLDGIVFAEFRSGTGPVSAVLRSSLDGFASDVFSFSTATSLPSSPNRSVTLGSAFASLTSSVEFRLFAFGASSAAGTWRITNTGATSDTPGLSVNGSLAAVPEPSSLMLLAIGIVASCLWGVWASRLRRSLRAQFRL